MSNNSWLKISRNSQQTPTLLLCQLLIQRVKGSNYLRTHRSHQNNNNNNNLINKITSKCKHSYHKWHIAITQIFPQISSLLVGLSQNNNNKNNSNTNRYHQRICKIPANLMNQQQQQQQQYQLMVHNTNLLNSSSSCRFSILHCHSWTNNNSHWRLLIFQMLWIITMHKLTTLQRSMGWIATIVSLNRHILYNTHMQKTTTYCHNNNPL